MTLEEYSAFMITVNEIEERIIDDDKYPVVRDNKIKICCKYTSGNNKTIYKLFEDEYK